ncbi:MAG TPA: FAD-dependent oxidoreductase, partial [Arsenicitalea sp.]|nr:FAD-dependent oxidoreductase [Arsenicitalea sp.]
MKQPNRLKPSSDHHFSGTDIDRSRPLRFRLNGRTVNGFAGDTVLSAAIASGINEAGRHLGSPLALSERFAPPVLPSSQLHLPQNALPMARLPAIDGMELSTLGTMRAAPAPRRIADIIRSLTIGPNRSLGLHLDGASPLAGPWLDQEADTHLDTDLAVVGGGIAGLSAAWAAAQAGGRVLLIERRASAGGDARFFGAVEGEEAPDQVIKRLLQNLGSMPNVTILTGTEAFAITGQTLRAHSIDIIDGAPAGRVLAVAFKRLVLANGVIERLPVFPGNRMPGVAGALETYHRGVRHGVWPGKSTLFNTAVSVVYRLAMLASDAGIAIERITDTRTQPQSRFIEFSKAYGIRLVRGLAPASVTAAPSRQAGVLVHLAPTFEGVAQQVPPIWTELLVTSGGWQPDLGLWLMAGGQC